MRNQRGFTLIELVIVLAMIMIVAAMAIPRLLHSRIAANEATAVSSIRTINSAETAYHAAFPTRGFATQLADLGGPSPCTPGPASACLIDRLLAGGRKSGYNFAAPGTTRAANGVITGYVAGAAPQSYDQSGIRLFCSMSDAILRFSPNQGHSTLPPDAAQCQAESLLE